MDELVNDELMDYLAKISTKMWTGSYLVTFGPLMGGCIEKEGERTWGGENLCCFLPTKPCETVASTVTLVS